MWNNNKMTENYVEKILAKNVVIMGWFSCLIGFCAEGTVLWLQAFFNRINGKHDFKMLENDLRIV